MPPTGQDPVTPTGLIGFQSGAVQSWTQENPNGMLLFNASGGTVTVPSDYQATGKAVAIYNAAGGTIQFQNVSVNCAFCGILFENQTLLNQHNWAEFKRCSVHKECFNNWSRHNAAHEHTICGVQGCSSRGTEFYSFVAYQEHFRTQHKQHCEEENIRVGRGFCPPCYWQHAYSHDANVTKCRVGGAYAR